MVVTSDRKGILGPLRMAPAPACFHCGYDLAGLDPRIVAVCPECGTAIDSDCTHSLLARESARRWRLAVLSPVFALPGLLVFIVGQPVLCFVLAAWFAFRAFEVDDELFRRPSSKVGRILQAFVFALAWTAFSTGMIALFAAVAMLVFVS